MRQTEVDLVDVGGGNTGSVRRCLQRLGVVYHDVGPDNLPDGSRPVILPGVGAFGAVMESLRRGGLDQRITELVRASTPYLGICVGMQILFNSSEESPNAEGLSLLPGKVVRFRAQKVPQIGWNHIQPEQNDGWEAGYVYFVNSYYPQPDNTDTWLYRADYGVPFCAAVHSGNITAFQFHPEKSGEFGGKLLQRWVQNVSRD